ncbi:MMPL family transporter [uncultured Pseudoteredinibacter sp.]|uniref:efflux RND transporter permease subunit n=1 Tax=uncultured Pseudoteredinibacter sp. TaxID=1641701 RepID=UPI0026201A2D|nr:MMPL family transporter [uncultured Pseudoteredinibacter sp.]
MLRGLAAFYQGLVIQRPWLGLVLVIALTALAAAGLPNFKLDASSESLTLENDKDLDYFREVYSRYQSGDFLVVTYRPNADLFSDQSINDLRSLSDELAQIEGVDSVLGMLDVPLLYSPKLSLTDLSDEPRTLMSEGVDRELAKQEFWNSPIYRDMLLSPDGRTTAILANLKVDNKYLALVKQRDELRALFKAGQLSAEQQQEYERVSAEFLDYRTQAAVKDKARVAKVREVVTSYSDRAEMFVGGVTMITADMIDFIQSDLTVFGLGIVIFIVLLLAVIFRQWRFIILPLSTCILTAVLMLGLLSWLDWRLTVISSNFVALLLITTLAITIHLVVRFRESYGEHPHWSKGQLVMDMVHYMLRPCLFTALTTVVAFVSLVVSGIRPVIDFGWMMTMGLAVGFCMAFILLPAGLMLWPLGEPKDNGDQSKAFTLSFSRFAEQRGGLVIVLSILAALASAYGISLLKVDNRFIDYFHKDTEIYQGMEAIDRRLGGTMPLEIIIDIAPEVAVAEEVGVEEDDEFSDEFDDEFGDDLFADESAEADTVYWFTSAGLRKVESLHDYLESLPEVGKVQSLAIAYKVAKDVNGGSLSDFELAILRQALPDSINDVLVKPYLALEQEQTRISMRLVETSADLDRMTIMAKIRDHAINELGFAPEQIHFSGMLVLYNNMLNSLFDSQIMTLGAVFIAIMVMFVILFRSFSLALVAIVPNMLAAFMVLGAMGIAGIPLDMMTITIAAITVGIAVDHEIHYITCFKREFAKDGNYIATMHRSHGTIGRALYYTAITIIVGFSVLSLSEFIPSIYFGLLTGGSMIAATLASLVLLPKLIILFKPLGPESA